MRGRENTTSLRTAISLSIALIVAILTAAVSYIAYTSSYATERSIYLAELSSFNRAINDQVQAFYDEQLGEARFLASLEAVKTASTGGDSARAAKLLKAL
jgi:hypothetical protein